MRLGSRLAAGLRTTSVGRSTLGPIAHRLREHAVTLRARLIDRRPERRERVRRLSRGLPLPPPSLRAKVIRNADSLTFLSSGRIHHEFLLGMLERNGIEPRGDVFDFGCGCGRVLRWWWLSGRPDVRLHGSDINAELISWCQEQLPFAETKVNGLQPPLPFADDSFDLVYTISIFTHLPEGDQRPWLEELMRVIKPGGHLILTTAGSAYADELTGEDRRAYEQGRLVVHFEGQPGSNLCAVYHPPDYVRELAAGYELVDSFAGDPGVHMRQDAYLLRAPGEPG